MSVCSVISSVILHLFLKLFSAGCVPTNEVFCEGMSKGDIEGIRIVGNPFILQDTLKTLLSDQEQVSLPSLMVSGKTCICISFFSTEVSSFACYPSTESLAVLSFRVCYISLIRLSNSNGQLSL